MRVVYVYVRINGVLRYWSAYEPQKAEKKEEARDNAHASSHQANE